VSVLILLCYQGTIKFGNPKDLVFGYTFGTHFFIYFFNYRSLRNFKVYLFWASFGVIHFYLFLVLKDESAFRMVEGHATTGLRNTISLLIVFQILRIISLNVQNQEFVAVSKSKTDLFDERPINFLDFLIFLVYLGAAVGLAMWK
jgi:hypothetical protein